MNANFLNAAKIVLGVEGGLSDHPADKGGRTNLGVTQATLTRARKIIPGLPEKVDDLTQPQALSIYEVLYWNEAKCGEMPPPVDFLVFDASINCGTGGGAKQLQRALNKMGANIKVDGATGPLTLNALNTAFQSNPSRIVYLINVERVRWHNDIISRDKTQLVFINGWLNRILKNIDISGV